MPEEHKCENCGDEGHQHHDQHKQQDSEATDAALLKSRMSKVKHKILVLSGKGGVGKSTVAVNLAVSLALSGKKTGLIDIDIHGPSIPQMLNITGERLSATGHSIIPLTYGENLKVISMGLLMQTRDEAVIWRGPMKMQVIKQFLKDVEWGDLDYLIVDSPPGTGDEPLSIVQLLHDADGAVIVTTPQEMSVVDVRRCVNFVHKVNLKVLGVIENMSGFVCPGCGERVDIFHRGGGKKMAEEMKVPYLGSIPIDKGIVDASDEGKPYVQHYSDSEASKEFKKIIQTLIQKTGQIIPLTVSNAPVKETVQASLRIAIPVAEGKLCGHFGHCENFALIDVNEAKKVIVNQVSIPSPGHQPGVLPEFLKGHGVNLILTGGMGSRAQDLFHQANIKLMLGVPEDTPENLVKAYLAGTLVEGGNVCDH